MLPFAWCFSEVNLFNVGGVDRFGVLSNSKNWKAFPQSFA